METIHRVTKGDGTFSTSCQTKITEGAVPCLLTGCPSYYSTISKTKRTRLSYESKEEELLNRTIQMSLTSETEETVKYKVNTLQDVKDKLTHISLPNNRLVWYRDNISTFILHSLNKQNISVDLHIEINCFLYANVFTNGRNISITSIESDDKLLTLPVEGSSRKILVQLTLIFYREIADNNIWR